MKFFVHTFSLAILLIGDWWVWSKAVHVPLDVVRSMTHRPVLETKGTYDNHIIHNV